MKFHFNERNKICKIIEENYVSGLSISACIWNAAIYYSQINIINKKDIFNKIVDFVEKNYPDFMYQSYVDIINKDIKKAIKYKIKEISVINITKSEMDKILSLNDIKKEKIAFVVLALAKYQNAASNKENDTFYCKISEVFKFARVTIPSKDRYNYFKFAYDDGIMKENFSVGFNALTAGFVDHNDDEIVLVLDEYDYLELAYAFLNYKNGGYKRCKECGRWFKIKQGKERVWYCPTHEKDYELIGEKEIKCIDCGKRITVLSKNTKTCRCEECQKEVLNEQWKIASKKYRESKKSS